MMFDSVLRKASHLIPDKMYLKLKFRQRLGKRLNLRNPKTFNEKLQWLKLYDRKPYYTKMVDKYEAKLYIADLIGEEYVIPTLGVWEKFSEIDFDKLPDRFVLKCTHDSGGLVICTNKEELDIDAARIKIEKCLNTNYFWHGREWPYKNVKPRIIAEPYLVDESEIELKDYKVYNFSGEPYCVEIHYNRFKNHLKSMYSIDWEKIDGVYHGQQDNEHVFNRPAVLNEMLSFARMLSKELSFLRTDFYIVDNKVLVGGLTLYPQSGYKNFTENWDEKLGKMVKIPGGGNNK